MLAETVNVSVTEVLPGALATTVIWVLAPLPAIVVLKETWFGSFGLPVETVGTCWPFTVTVMSCAPVAVPVTGIWQVENICPFRGEVIVRLRVPGMPTIIMSPGFGLTTIGLNVVGPVAGVEE